MLTGKYCYINATEVKKWNIPKLELHQDKHYFDCYMITYCGFFLNFCINRLIQPTLTSCVMFLWLSSWDYLMYLSKLIISCHFWFHIYDYYKSLLSLWACISNMKALRVYLFWDVVCINGTNIIEHAFIM